MPIPPPDDAQLVKAAKAGDGDAASRLFDRHWDGVWRTAYVLLSRRAEADDVAQDALVSAFSSLDRFEGRGTFRTWVTRIAINKALNTLRGERRLAPYRDELESHQDDQSSAELLDALAGLSVERRTVVVLRYWLGCSPSEIANLLDLPEGTVNSRLARGVRELRAFLEVNCFG